MIFTETVNLAFSIFFAVTAFVAVVCWFFSNRLCLQSAAVLISSACWFLFRFVLIPWVVRNHARSSFDDNVSGIALGTSFDCCGMAFGSYHFLLFVALLINVARSMRRKAEE